MEVGGPQNDYFTSYEDLEIHKLMLEDAPRTEAYKNAILGNKYYFKDKVVMDVGCGTGILSIFCAQAGAKKVYAVEASNLANLSRDIVKENNFQDVIEIIHSKVEDVILPENMKVDAIISEWMGFYLFHEGMLDSVFVARDKFLKENGRMFPETATLYVAPCSVPSLYNKWDNIYGVSMSTFAKHLRSSKSIKPEVMVVDPGHLLGPEEALCWVDLRQYSTEEVNHFEIEHVVAAKKNGAYQGMCLWFDCTFPDFQIGDEETQTTLSTSPSAPPTHWKQTIIVLPEEQNVELDEPIAFKLSMTRDSENFRRYILQFTMLDPEQTTHPLGCSCYLTKCILINAYLKEHPDQHSDIPKMAVENGIVEETIDDDNDDG